MDGYHFQYDPYSKHSDVWRRLLISDGHSYRQYSVAHLAASPVIQAQLKAASAQSALTICALVNLIAEGTPSKEDLEELLGTPVTLPSGTAERLVYRGEHGTLYRTDVPPYFRPDGQGTGRSGLTKAVQCSCWYDAGSGVLIRNRYCAYQVHGY